ncbi:class III extradiol ring-cleavage dioxygenase [Leptolyngbya sp. FACHB-261]|uniref:DODA-type extradiol aromatic ring-opening family dioxygenase n=1 Tax=Leptolyngbya sp. FACHB-261 TaxID=2692806 RepID=UPI001684BC56|nr:class III extradiol ring-cleavage dioxygenase [Leptolyngbya sp. FACHB-261]MBD2104406.1 dioxygenase [Leptolyngbya sp. FACHB-261]
MLEAQHQLVVGSPDLVGTTFPSLFVSHGAPNLVFEDAPAHHFLKQLGTQVGRPSAILVISAHWATACPTVSAASQPETIHDFSAFTPELYQLRYPAAGAPDLAERVVNLLVTSGIEAELDPSRGLDHGAWNPLLLMYPDAEIPVTQLSLQPRLGPAHHLAIGQALAPLRHEGVLMLASGSLTHNLWELEANRSNAQAPVWASEFVDWITAAATDHKLEQLLNYRQLAPHAERNHPTEEHLLPLFVAIGAGNLGVKTRLLHSSFTYGSLSMAAYAFA